MDLDKYENMPMRGRMKNASDKDDGLLLNTCPCCKKKVRLIRRKNRRRGRDITITIHLILCYLQE